MSSDGRLYFESMKRAFWDGYDVLWRLILVNVIAFFLSLTVFGFVFALIGVVEFVKGVVDGRPPRVVSIWNPKGRIVLVLVFLMILFISTFLMWVNVQVYLGPIRRSHPLAGLALAGAVAWIWIVIVCVAGLWLPLRLWLPDMRRRWKVAGLLFLKHGGIVVLCAFQCFSILFLLVVSGAGLVLFGFVVPFLIWFEMFRAIACAEGLIEKEREPEARTFRDILRPWEG